jgi:hypothetical protein
MDPGRLACRPELRRFRLSAKPLLLEPALYRLHPLYCGVSLSQEPIALLSEGSKSAV